MAQGNALSVSDFKELNYFEVKRDLESGEKGYQTVMHNLLRALDIENGIQTQWNNDIMVRNANNARSLSQQFGAQNEEIEALQMLMRAVGTASGLDHVLRHENREDLCKELNSYVANLFNVIADYRTMINTNNKEMAEKIYGSLKKIHKDFNNNLIAVATKAGLHEGLKDQKDWVKFLNLLRDLNSVRYPAESVQTTRTFAGVEIAEIAKPITVKTDEQKQQKLPESKKPAMQKVQDAFDDLIHDDTRRLGPQARKFAPATVKNGWDVELKIGDTSYKLGRCGTITYVGKNDNVIGGEAGREVQAYRNLAQLKSALTPGAKKEEKESKLVFITLNTDLPYDKENTIVQDSREAAKLHHMTYANFAANAIGKWTQMKIYSPNGEIDNSKFNADREDRHKEIVDHIVGLMNRGYTPVFACASGSDRTGTIYTLVVTACILNELTKQAFNVLKEFIPDIPKHDSSSTTVETQLAYLTELRKSLSTYVRTGNLTDDTLTDIVASKLGDRQTAQQLLAFIKEPYPVAQELAVKALTGVMLSGGAVPGSFWYKASSYCEGALPKICYSEKDTNKDEKSNPVSSNCMDIVKAHAPQQTEQRSLRRPS